MMGLEFSGIERRLDELSERLARLRALAERPQAEFRGDPLLRDLVERNFEVAIQCCLDIAHRVISLTGAQRPRDYYESVLRLGELGVVSAALAQTLAPAAGFRNILAHEYLSVDWDLVYERLLDLDPLEDFGNSVRDWLLRGAPGTE
jgi:uncharacterized protein YutE (UPF0331/DUF86 family)